MPTTSNFGWTTPADTDLVKDGAAAIRTLGNGIDTSFLDLKGGTTGQVLSKASNTDLDFSWIAVDPLTILDAKGDLISATAADTPARLAVGTNGQYLSADSSTSTGLKWVTPAGGGKVLQVVSATYSTETTVASETFTDTGLSLAITPTSASSKVLVIVSQVAYVYREVSPSAGAYKILRGATDIVVVDAANQMAMGIFAGTTGIPNLGIRGIINYTYLDSPATTSSTTYKTQGRAFATANAGSIVFNSDPSQITLLEIGA